MFAWLKHLFHKVDRYDLYTPGERRIFHYFDGANIVHADPIVLYKRLMDRSTDIDIDRKVAASESIGATQAHTSLVGHIRHVFDVKNLAEGGLTDAEVTDLLDHFLVYLDQSKKNSATSTTSSPNLAASVPSSDASPPTMNSPDSGSTANGPFTVKQKPSPSGSASPTAPSIPAGDTGRPSPMASPKPS